MFLSLKKGLRKWPTVYSGYLFNIFEKFLLTSLMKIFLSAFDSTLPCTINTAQREGVSSLLCPSPLDLIPNFPTVRSLERHQKIQKSAAITHQSSLAWQSKFCRPLWKSARRPQEFSFLPCFFLTIFWGGKKQKIFWGYHSFKWPVICIGPIG